MAPAAVATRPVAGFFDKALTSDEILDLKDAQLEALREQLDKLKRELEATAAERDYLRHASTIYDGHHASLQRRRTSDPADALTPANPATLPGTSLAADARDPRIGRPRRILVVGGGPAGIISLLELLSPVNRRAGAALDVEVCLYERRAEVGGVWYFEPGNDVAKGWESGSGEYVRAEGGERVERGVGTGQKVAPWWPTPAYDGLVGNVLPPLIEFTGYPMPKPKGGLFPSMSETFEYLHRLAEPVREHITVHRQVTSIQPDFSDGRLAPRWIVKSNDWSPDADYDNSDPSARAKTEHFDAVIIAAGAFDVPFYPPTDGLQPLLNEQSPLVMHARTYPGPLPFLNRRNRIVVVGNANSANDIAAHLAPLNSEGPLFRSVRHESRFPHLKDNRIVDVPPIARIEKADSPWNGQETLTLHLEDGDTLTGITKLIFASGYQYSFDWVKVPNPCSPLFTNPSSDRNYNEQIDLVPASRAGAVPNLHLTTFMATAPTLSFIGLGAGSTPCPLAEVQARAAARVYHGLLALPYAPKDPKVMADPQKLLDDFNERVKDLDLDNSSPHGWRGLHMIRGAPERELHTKLLNLIERSESGASDGLFRWDAEREGVVKTMRTVKEGELRRLRDKKVASGGVIGGIGGVLALPNLIAPQGRAASNGGEYKRGMAVGL